MAKRRFERLRMALINDIEEELAEETEYGKPGSAIETKLSYTIAKIEGARPRGLFLIAKQRNFDLETVLRILEMDESAEIIITHPKEPWAVSDFREWST